MCFITPKLVVLKSIAEERMMLFDFPRARDGCHARKH
jgi:hypothetical protein